MAIEVSVSLFEVTAAEKTKATANLNLISVAVPRFEFSWTYVGCGSPVS